jgi:hypothetical protein
MGCLQNAVRRAAAFCGGDLSRLMLLHYCRGAGGELWLQDRSWWPAWPFSDVL